MMNITEVRIVKKDFKQLRGFASIVIDDCLVVKNIKIIDGRDGLFIAMPSQKLRNGEYKDVVHPLNSETRNELQSLILSKYHECTDNESTTATARKEEMEDIEIDENSGK